MNPKNPAGASAHSSTGSAAGLLDPEEKTNSSTTMRNVGPQSGPGRNATQPPAGQIHARDFHYFEDSEEFED
jgi:hypothetical protein